ncbi:conserved hypothetical protein [sediment metagenome]|uniref:Uncharacterized protein n=1 Tax=sediment metagenome TaxID=749907 RepID=D9PFX2_9ZZZZ
MQSVSIGEIQKNISLITKLKESVSVIDKRKNKIIAIITPTHENSVIDELVGKYTHLAKNIKDKDLNTAREKAMIEAMREKYGISH